MHKKTLFALVALSLSVLLLAACSGGNSQGTSNSFDVSVKDEFKFSPDAITVSAGKTVTVNFTNNASVAHNLNFLKPEAEFEHLLEEIKEGAGEHIDEELLTDMHDVEPGHTETVSFTAPAQPGEYKFICTTPGHAEAGMVGTFKVVP